MRNIFLASILLGGTLILSACAGTSTTVTADLATAQADAQKAILAYNNLKVVAAAAELAYPQYAAAITKAEGVADPIVAELTPLVTDASADAATIEALVAQIVAQEAAVAAAVKGG